MKDHDDFDDIYDDDDELEDIPDIDDLLESHNMNIETADISGIQSFIYDISSKAALKGLRARSFYLELILAVC